MKRVIFLTVIFVSMLISCDSNDNPNLETPSVVLNAFQAKFPGAKDVEWEKFKEDYEVEFEIERIDYTAIIANEGNLIKYKYDILSTELPEAVNKSIKTNYDFNKIDDTEILKIDENTYYQVEFEGNIKDDKVIFNADGEENTDIEYLD